MKKINLELAVGLFLLAGFFCFVYLSLKLGEVSIFANEKSYTLVADFDSISGLKEGAILEIAGVNIGKVTGVILGENDRARVYMQIPKEIAISEDTVASVRTQGIIGDKYIRIIPGGSDEILQDGDFIFETESAIDIEEMVSKYIFGDV
ncbi:MAG: outer membrane lipid asymmetry maintenance protein MlaD [Desulfobulbaceae bacterium]|nr:outer membrane lipid asymmetry maintenance protein MlaD [Desulfobulbaceae bacterium]